jgi:hypothetical protein
MPLNIVSNQATDPTTGEMLVNGSILYQILLTLSTPIQLLWETAGVSITSQEPCAISILKFSNLMSIEQVIGIFANHLSE